MSVDRNIRLYINQELSEDKLIELEEKATHYLRDVMRCRINETIRCFNQTNGEFIGVIETLDKKKLFIRIQKQIRQPQANCDIWLIFAPLKKDKTDFVIEKAVELGVSKIIPVITRYTNTGKIKTERFVAQAIEAAEQCGRLSVPVVDEPVSLKKLLASWDDKRVLFFMNERRQGKSAADTFRAFAGQPAAVLIGPEGGFSEDEALDIGKCSFAVDLSLGPRILRAETAAAAALAVWQAEAGDWKDKE